MPVAFAGIIPRVASNVELLRELFARFNETGDMDFSRVHRDVELHDRPDVPDGAASGTPIEVDEAQLWTFRGGLLVRLQAFPTIEEAYATASALDEDEGIEPAAPVSPSAVRAGARIPPSSGQSGQRRHARKIQRARTGDSQDDRFVDF